jgi:hypothetical protein
VLDLSQWKKHQSSHILIWASDNDTYGAKLKLSQYRQEYRGIGTEPVTKGCSWLRLDSRECWLTLFRGGRIWAVMWGISVSRLTYSRIQRYSSKFWNGSLIYWCWSPVQHVYRATRITFCSSICLKPVVLTGLEYGPEEMCS